MGFITGGEMVARALKHEGVHQVFALSGGHLDPIFQACVDHDIRIIDVRHEAAATHAADGYARATGKPGVAIVTAGPGVTNALTGVANAFMDAVPLICIGGRAPIRDEDRLPLQGMDQVALMAPVTKLARTVLHPDRIPEYMAMAFRYARTGRPGPVFLDIPIDVLFTPADERDVPQIAHYVPEGRPAPSVESIDAALDILERAERPVIFAGGGAWFAGAQGELRAFAELARIPVFANSKARGLVSEYSELGYGGFGLAASPVAVGAGGGPPDVVLMLGARLGMFTGSSGGSPSLIPEGATLIQVDIEPEEIGRCRDVQLGLVGDVREALRLMLDRARGRSFADHERWIAALVAAREAARKTHEPAMFRAETPIHQARLARDIASVVGPDGIIVADGGETSIWMGDQAIIDSGGRWLSHGYLGCLGVGIPFGLAAKIAHPDRRVLVISGDGSIGLNFAEFDTLVRHDVPVVVVVNNDHGWGMIRHGQVRAYGEDRVIGAELGPVRYDLAAAGFGAHAELVTEGSSIRAALERAFASGKPACLNVMTDPTLPIWPTVRRAKQTPATEEETDQSAEDVELPYYGKRKLGARS